MNHSGLARVTSLLALLVGCVTDPELDTLDAEEHWIENGALASSFQVGRAAQLSRERVAYCSATQIDADSVLTALHCMPALGDTVAFWTSPTTLSETTRTVVEVILPKGTGFDFDTGQIDDIDSYGDRADLAVLRLSLPMRRSSATLAWHYPGHFWPGAKVGSGQHEDVLEAGVELRQRWDFTHGGDADGVFRTNVGLTNDGDSGGPFYVQDEVVGVLIGSKYDPEAEVWRGLHTSVPHHLDFILAAMDYQWPFGPLDFGLIRGGDAIEISMYGSRDVCSYACAKTSECVAFTYYGGGFSQCWLLGTVNDTATGAGFTSGMK